ncbi:MAG: hypothetical protein DLM73_08965 [Chthoniobacterales bacterium]|nr:MAG: hypothetical protein DLM73_08965 [Chthoniobacterales bacterium]
MSFELDIRAVGTGTTSGDAIAMRYGTFNGNSNAQRVIVVDGGFQENGDDLVRFIQNVYGTRRVDLVICTHPHDDHVNGLHEIFDNLQVGSFWMHRPWEHADSVAAYVREKRMTTQKFSDRLRRSLENAYELEKLAIRKGITPVEPFAGVTFDNRLFVIGPSPAYYENLVCEFGEATTLGGTFAEYFQAIPRKAAELRRRISEAIEGEDQLVEPAENDVNARNNSSAIIVARLEDKADVLLTADAGVPALTRAADYAERSTYRLEPSVRYFQVPHHGSKRNLGPSILNRIIGSPHADSKKQAFVSASNEWDKKHPSMRVTNALRRRGATVSGTQRKSIVYRSADVPMRAGWKPVVPIPFTSDYDEED